MLPRTVSVFKEEIGPVGVTCDDIGHVYVAHVSNDRSLIFRSSNGEFLQEIKLEGVGHIQDIKLSNGRLTVLHGRGKKISVFYVT